MNRPSTIAALIALSAATFGKLAVAGSAAMQYALLASAPYSMEAAQANDRRQQVVALLSVLAVLAALVAFFVWLFRSKKRIVALGMEGGEYSPGLTVGSFFIPFLNLYLPIAAVRELWQSSGAPRSWKEQPSSALVGCWWIAWVVNAIMGAVVGIVTKNSAGLEELKTATLWMLVGAFLGIASQVSTLVLVLLISRRVRRCEQAEETRAGGAVPPPLPVVV